MRLIRYTTWLLAALLLAACSRTDPDALARAEARNQELQAQVQELESRLEASHRPVNLVDSHYPPAVGGSEGWKYHKVLSVDLNGDGTDERVSVTTNAYWDSRREEFGWDDGHPWHVYIEAADGTKTYVFSNWVQMGQLDVILDEEQPGLFLVQSRAGSLAVYRVTYRGPGQAQAVQLLVIPLSPYATFAP